MNNIIGNGQKKHADIFVNNVWIGRVTYYYWSEDNKVIRLHDKNKYVVAQFFTNKVKDNVQVVLEEEDDPVYDNFDEE